MTTSTTLPSGVHVTFPTSFRITPAPTPVAGPVESRRRRGPPVGRGPIPMPTSVDLAPNEAQSSRKVLVQSLEEHEFTLVDTVTFEGRAPGASEPPVIEVGATVAGSENAVLLVDRDGLLCWITATESARDVSSDNAPAPRRRGDSTETRRVTFRVQLDRPAARARTRAVGGALGELVVEKICAVVFKFAAKILVGAAMKSLERNVPRGLVLMTPESPAQWKRVDDASQLKNLPRDRAPRILLFVHGTFSSTTGTFGVLPATPWGMKILQAAGWNYDAVIGFEHPTLSEDPIANAKDLLQRLERRSWDSAPAIDFVSHGSGALVVRSLLQHVLPASQFRPRIGPVISVAGTNAGTTLATPQHWTKLIDLYTNLAVAAMRLLERFPQTAPTALILRESIQGLAALIKHVAIHALDTGGVPGLAAMDPRGSFINKLDQPQRRQTIPGASWYAVTSAFWPSISGVGDFGGRFAGCVASSRADALTGEPNDLIVNVSSMIAVDGGGGARLADRFDFGSNTSVHHLNYFMRPEVTNALGRWLDLVEVSLKSGTKPAPVPQGLSKWTGVGPTGRLAPARGAGLEATRAGPTGKPGPAPREGLKAKRASPTGTLEVGRGSTLLPRRSTSSFGRVISIDPPAAIDTDVLLAPAHRPLGDLMRAVSVHAPSYVIVQRLHEHELLNYAFKAEDVLAMPKSSARDSVEVAFDLHESGASLSGIGPFATLPYEEGIISGERVRRRGVMLENGKPVGVLPEEPHLGTSEDLPRLAQASLKPKTAQDRVLARRAMPTLKSGSGKQVSLHFRAEMDDHVVLKNATSLEVLISRKSIPPPREGRVTHSAKANAEPGKKLLVRAIAKQGFELIGDGNGLANVLPPEIGQPASVLFDLRAIEIGVGEVWVEINQAQVTLATLVVRTEIVTTPARSAQGRTMVQTESAEAEPLRAPIHRLTITEVGRGKKIAYQFFLESEKLGIIDQDTSKPIETDRETYVNGIYKRIEERWVTTKGDVKEFLEEIRAYGGELFDRLVPEKIRKLLWKHRKSIESILVTSTEPFIPWELLHLKDPATRRLPPERLQLGGMGLVRWLHGSPFPPARIPLRAERCRYVIPNYPHSEYALPQLKEEEKFLKNTFDAKMVTPDKKSLRKLLEKPSEFDVFHFAGHGRADSADSSRSELLLEGRIEADASGKLLYIPEIMTASEVSQSANFDSTDEAPHRPMIVLNACQLGRLGKALVGVGGFAEAFLGAGAGAFVGSLWSVGDVPAFDFARKLYSELKAGKELAAAVIEARKVALNDATGLAYAVYGHPHLKLKVSTK